jgi:hypothetical protein
VINLFHAAAAGDEVSLKLRPDMSRSAKMWSIIMNNFGVVCSLFREGCQMVYLVSLACTSCAVAARKEGCKLQIKAYVVEIDMDKLQEGGLALGHLKRFQIMTWVSGPLIKVCFISWCITMPNLTLKTTDAYLLKHDGCAYLPIRGLKDPLKHRLHMCRF